MVRRYLLLCGVSPSSSRRKITMQPPYSTVAFIETLRPERHGFVTRLIDPISGASYGHVFQLARSDLENHGMARRPTYSC
jgi:hypothetical protein